MKDKRVYLQNFKNEEKHLSAYIKSSGKFWKRLLHKRARQNALNDHLELRIKKANSYKFNAWFWWD